MITINVHEESVVSQIAIGSRSVFFFSMEESFIQVNERAFTNLIFVLVNNGKVI